MKSTISSLLVTIILWFFGCSKDSIDPVQQCSLLVETVEGNYQYGATGEFLSDSVVFCITDAKMVPEANVDVGFKVISGGGYLSDLSRKTNDLGLVKVKWRIGSGVDQLIKAEVKDENGLVSSSFSVANTPIQFNTKWITGVQFKVMDETINSDERILESNNILLFSNGSSDDIKALYAKIAEEHLWALKSDFGLSIEELGIVDLKSKIKIYSNHTPGFNEPGTYIHPNYGIMFYEIGSNGFNRIGLRHELMHIVEILMIGVENFYKDAYSPVWFSEGIAEYQSNRVCACPHPINSVAELNSWKDTHQNPLSIIEWSDFETGFSGCQYYNMFGLVITYLLDPKGLGKSCVDIKNMYKDMASSKNFNKSFKKCMGISVEDLKSDLYDRLAEYILNGGGYIDVTLR